MANRSLRGMGFDKDICEVLEKKKFTTCAEIVGRPTIDLVYDLDLSLPVVMDLTRIVSIKISPNPDTVMGLLNKRESTNFVPAVPTSLPILDAYLRGGITIGSLTEVNFF